MPLSYSVSAYDNKGGEFICTLLRCITMWKSLLIALCVLEGLVVSSEVFALQPFVTTDADVVEPNLVEIELGVFGLHEQKHPGHDEIT
mgnify:FL=1